MPFGKATLDDKFYIMNTMGEGGNAKVVRGVQIDSTKPVAIKIMKNLDDDATE